MSPEVPPWWAWRLGSEGRTHQGETMTAVETTKRPAGRDRHIPAAEAFANRYFGKLNDVGTWLVEGPTARAKWNRTFHFAMQELVEGRTPEFERVSFANLPLVD